MNGCLKLIKINLALYWRDIFETALSIFAFIGFFIDMFGTGCRHINVENKGSKIK